MIQQITKTNNDHRKTYIGSDSYYNDELLQTIDDIRENLQNIEYLLNKYQKQQKLRRHPQFMKMLQTHPQLIQKLIHICLQPEKLNVKNFMWPFIARNILKDNLSVLFSLKQNIKWLLDFLYDSSNSTVLGYFEQIVSPNNIVILSNRNNQVPKQQINQLKEKFLHFFTKNKQYYELCLNKCQQPQIFKFLFECATITIKNQNQQQQHILRDLFYRIKELNNRFQIYENVCDMTQAFMENTEKLQIKLIERITIILQQQYIILLIQKLKLLSIEHQQESEFIILILTNIVKFYQKIVNSKIQIQSSLLQILQTSITRIIFSIEYLIQILNKPCLERKFSTGESIQQIGFFKFYILDLIRVILQLDPKLVKKNVDINKCLLILIQRYLTLNKWNNLVHLVIQKIIVLLYDHYQTYDNYEQRYFGKEGFLCFLIENFRSKHFLFLDSNNISTYGNIHTLYNISKLITVKLSQSVKLKEIMLKFQPWQIFIRQDLNIYQQNLQQQLGGQAPKLMTQSSPLMSVKQLLCKLQQKQKNAKELLDQLEIGEPMKKLKKSKSLNLNIDDPSMNENYIDFRYVSNKFQWEQDK